MNDQTEAIEIVETAEVTTEVTAIADKLLLISLLQKQEFNKLNIILLSYQKQYESNQLSEKEVAYAFATFSNVDPALAVLLDEWVTALPKSYPARLAKGIYLYYLGFALRGTKYSGETHRAQFGKMREILNNSILTLQESTRLTSQPTIAYSYIIKAANASSSEQIITYALTEGLAINPASYTVRRARFYSLQPHWGGSLSEIADFISDTEKYVKENPDLLPLLGYLNHSKANILSRKDKRKRAIHFNNLSLQHGDFSLYLLDRGINYFNLGEYDKAIMDFTTSLKRWPQHADTLDWRGAVYKKLEKYDKAIADYNLAITLSPYDATRLKYRGFLLAEMGQYKKANIDLEKSTYYNPFDAHVYYNIGWNNLYKIKNYNKAEKFFKKAIDIKPQNAKYRYTYSHAINLQFRCKDLISSINDFLNVCQSKKQKFCTKDKIDWANKSLQMVSNGSACT